MRYGRQLTNVPSLKFANKTISPDYYINSRDRTLAWWQIVSSTSYDRLALEIRSYSGSLCSPWIIK
jgi:hypothetical protein